MSSRSPRGEYVESMKGCSEEKNAGIAAEQVKSGWKPMSKENIEQGGNLFKKEEIERFVLHGKEVGELWGNLMKSKEGRNKEEFQKSLDKLNADFADKVSQLPSSLRIEAHKLRMAGMVWKRLEEKIEKVPGSCQWNVLSRVKTAYFDCNSLYSSVMKEKKMCANEKNITSKLIRVLESAQAPSKVIKILLDIFGCKNSTLCTAVDSAIHKDWVSLAVSLIENAAANHPEYKEILIPVAFALELGNAYKNCDAIGSLLVFGAYFEKAMNHYIFEPRERKESDKLKKMLVEVMDYVDSTVKNACSEEIKDSESGSSSPSSPRKLPTGGDNDPPPTPPSSPFLMPSMGGDGGSRRPPPVFRGDGPPLPPLFCSADVKSHQSASQNNSSLLSQLANATIQTIARAYMPKRSSQSMSETLQNTAFQNKPKMSSKLMSETLQTTARANKPEMSSQSMSETSRPSLQTESHSIGSLLLGGMNEMFSSRSETFRPSFRTELHSIGSGALGGMNEMFSSRSETSRPSFRTELHSIGSGALGGMNEMFSSRSETSRPHISLNAFSSGPSFRDTMRFENRSSYSSSQSRTHFAWW